MWACCVLRHGTLKPSASIHLADRPLEPVCVSPDCARPGLGFILLQLVYVAKVPACFEFQPTWIMSTSILFLLFPSLCLYWLAKLKSGFSLFPGFIFPQRTLFLIWEFVVWFIAMWEGVQLRIQISRIPRWSKQKASNFALHLKQHLTYWVCKFQRLFITCW